MKKLIQAIAVCLLLGCTQTYRLKRDRDILVPLLQTMVEDDQRFRRDLYDVEEYRLKQDSIDNRNTQLLLDITGKYGFPYAGRLNHNFPVQFIFVHAPQDYWPQIDAVMKKEHENDNIGDLDYQFILWHINGRVGMPFKTDENGRIIK